MALKFSNDLDMLGLTVPTPQGNGGNTIRADGAWSDFNGKDRSTVMAETVVGLAGSSYRSAW
jgi:hypothetical protein